MSFSEVDAAPHAALMVQALDRIALQPAVQRLKAAAVEMLAPKAGQQVVDVGSGTGEDARVLASYVGETGRTIGIEPSEIMIGEAVRRHGGAGLMLEFRQGDATKLDLEDASVDGIRCERVFQHLADPAAAMAEFVRVVKPGGRIVIIDTDWGMNAIHGADPDVTALIVRSWWEAAANGWSGRRLPALFNAVGMPEPRIVADTFIQRSPDLPTGPPFTLMSEAAVQSGAITSDEATTWLAQLAEAAQRNEFFWAATMFAVGSVRGSEVE